MLTYYGTKKVLAEPQSKDGVLGYKVVYEDGYESWSPKQVFEGAYQATDKLSFEHAFRAMKEGHSVSRWNAPYCIRLQVPDEHSKMQHPYIYMDPGNSNYSPWIPSYLDLFATDWRIAE